MLALVLYLLIIGAGTGGELCVARAMKAVGEVKDFRPSALLGLIPRVLRVPWMWAGVALMATAFFSLLAVLSKENVSLVVPVTALSYGAGALGGKKHRRIRAPLGGRQGRQCGAVAAAL